MTVNDVFIGAFLGLITGLVAASLMRAATDRMRVLVWCRRHLSLKYVTPLGVVVAGAIAIAAGQVLWVRVACVLLIAMQFGLVWHVAVTAGSD